MSKQANVYGFSTPYLGVVSTATNLGKKTPEVTPATPAYGHKYQLIRS